MSSEANVAVVGEVEDSDSPVLNGEEALEAVTLLLSVVEPLALGLGKEFVGAIQALHCRAEQDKTDDEDGDSIAAEQNNQDPPEEASSEEPASKEVETEACDEDENVDPELTKMSIAGISVVLQRVALNTAMRGEDWEDAQSKIDNVENAIRRSWPGGLKRMTTEDQLDVSMAVESFEEPSNEEEFLLTKALAHAIRYARSLKSEQERALTLRSLSELLDREDSLLFFLRKEAIEAKPESKEMPENFGAESEMVAKPVGVSRKRQRRRRIITGLCMLLACAGVAFFLSREKEVEERKNWKVELINFRLARAEVRSKIQSLLKSYHEGATVEDRLPFIKDGERLKPIMKDYYLSYPLEKGFDAILDIQEGDVAEKKVVRGRASREGKEFSFFAMEVGEGDYLLDWKAIAGQGSIAWRNFVISGAGGPGQYRVRVETGNFYGGRFSSRTDYACFKMTDHAGNDICYGYCERRSDAARKLLSFMRKAEDEVVEVILMLDGMIQTSNAFPQVVIMDLSQDHWFDSELIFGAMPQLPKATPESPFGEGALPEGLTDPSLLESDNPFGELETVPLR